MAGARLLYPHFRDEQGDSKYPFADTATLRSDTNENAAIAADTFIDAVFFPVSGGRRVYISTITVTTQTVTIVIGDALNTARATASYAALQPPVDGVLTFSDEYGRPAGTLLSTKTNLSRFSAWAVGAYSFSTAATEFVASVTIPAAEPGVRAVQPETREFMTGDIWLVGDQGVVLRQEGENIIRIDIVVVPLFKRALCEPQTAGFPAANYLQTINGCGPDAYGNFTFTATNQAVDDTVLRVYPDNGTIVIDAVGRSLA